MPHPNVTNIAWNFSNKSPRIILRKKLTEVEERYGEGETVESVWREYCPNPEEYEEPVFGQVTKEKSIRDFSLVGYSGNFEKYWKGAHSRLPYVYALKKQPPKKRYLKVPLNEGNVAVNATCITFGQETAIPAHSFPGATIIEE